MVRAFLTYCYVACLCFGGHSVYAQGHLWSNVEMSKAQVYIGEPVVVTVSVYTSTWFTKGIDIQNIQVNDAFTVYFRSLSTSKVINRKTYAGVQFFYYVFPYTENDITFSSLTIEVETPNEGDSKGVPRKLTTNTKSLKVLPVPGTLKNNEWLVTPSLTVSDKWVGDLTNVKVGDVIERRIYRKAQESVSELIPPIDWDTISGVSLYPGRAITNNIKSKTSISAERRDMTHYLFEKEGQVTIPEVTIYWWNASRKKLYKRILEEKTIDVQPNPDLGMLATIKDSLAIVQNNVLAGDEQKPFQFLGMNLKQFLLFLVVASIVFYFLIKYLKILLLRFRTRRELYLQSELHYFHQFIGTLTKDDVTMRNAFYRWIDCLELEEYTLEYFSSHWVETTTDAMTIPNSKRTWQEARKKYLQGNDQNIDGDHLWINP